MKHNKYCFLAKRVIFTSLRNIFVIFFLFIIFNGNVLLAQIDKSNNAKSVKQDSSTLHKYQKEKAIFRKLIGGSKENNIENQEDEFNAEDQEDNITTKIYKSTDPYLDTAIESSNENRADVNSAVEDIVITKEELIKNKTNSKSKITSKKLNDQKSDKKSAVNNRSNHGGIYPWFILFFLIALLIFIFKYLVKSK